MARVELFIGEIAPYFRGPVGMRIRLVGKSDPQFLQWRGALSWTPCESCLLATVHMYSFRAVKVDCSPTVHPPVNDVISKTFLPSKHVAST